jgi:hypothetical protein
MAFWLNQQFPAVWPTHLHLFVVSDLRSAAALRYRI